MQFAFNLRFSIFIFLYNPPKTPSRVYRIRTYISISLATKKNNDKIKVVRWKKNYDKCLCFLL